MIKNILIAGLTFVGFCASSQNFSVTYGFSDVSNATGTVDPTNTPIVTGLTLGTFLSFGASANSNASGRFSFSNWPVGALNAVDNYSNFTAALSPTIYYEVCIKVKPSYTLSINTLTFAVRRSGTGIRHYCVRSNKDSYTNNLAASTGTNSKLSVVPTNIFYWNYDSVSTANDQKGSSIQLDSQFANITDSVVFHFYAWNSEANGGTFSIDNVSFAGSVTDTSGSVGIAEENQKIDLEIYPNPSENRGITVFHPNGATKIELISPEGVLIMQKEPGAQTLSTSLEPGSLAPGFYFIRVLSGKEVYSRKIVLQ